MPPSEQTELAIEEPAQSGPKPKTKRGKPVPDAPEVHCVVCNGVVYSDPINATEAWCNYCAGIAGRIAEDGAVALLATEMTPEQIVERVASVGEALARRLRGRGRE